VAFVVVYDACVLYPMPVADLLIRLAQTPIFRAHWSNQILDEVDRALRRERPDMLEAAIQRRRKNVLDSVRDCLVTNFEDLVAGLHLPDDDDRHVLAAAIKCAAQVIVTANLKDFPKVELAKYDIDAQAPDTFVQNVLSIDSKAVMRVIEAQAAALKKPPTTVSELLEKLSNAGLTRSAAQLAVLL